MARISPVAGTMATTAPGLSPRACLAMSSRLLSMVSLTSLPETGAVSSTTLTFRPRASTS